MPPIGCKLVIRKCYLSISFRQVFVSGSIDIASGVERSAIPDNFNRYKVPWRSEDISSANQCQSFVELFDYLMEQGFLDVQGRNKTDYVLIGPAR